MKKIFLAVSFLGALGIYVLGQGRTTFSPTSSKEKQIQQIQSVRQGVLPATDTTSTIDYTTYTKSPFNLPLPSGKSDVQYDADTLARANSLGGYVARHQSYLQSKFSGHKEYVDPFASVIWNVAIEGTYANPFEWNCLNGGNAANTVNDGCPPNGFDSGDWQVNGAQVPQAAPHMVDDFKEVYGNTDAATVKSIGDRIIADSKTQILTVPYKYAGITKWGPFPNKDLQTLVTEATGGNNESQNYLAILLMDPELGAVVASQEIASDIAGHGGDWVAAMHSWTYTDSDIQKYSNHAKYLADRYTGSVSNSPSGSTAAGPAINIAPLSLLVRPKKGVKDVYIINKATAVAVSGGSNSSSGTNNPAATGDLAEVLGWAQKINDALEPGYDYETGDTWYDKMVADICNGDSKGDWCASKSPANDRSDLYWCTFTVVDSFNLTHKKGLTYDHLAVIDMVAFWKNTSGYVYINYQSDPKTALQTVVPGTPFFLANDLSQTTEHEHTGIVKTISIDQNGNGSITTLESNSTAKSHTFPIENWDVKNVFFTLQGFGGIN